MAFDPVSAAFDLGGEILKRIFPDPAQRAEAQLKLETMKQTGELAQLTADTDIAKAQIAVNQVEAGNASLWVSGWRPGIGWGCGAAFVWMHILQPILLFGFSAYGHPIALPTLDQGGDTVLLGILGINGGLRTVEKLSVGGGLPWQK